MSKRLPIRPHLNVSIRPSPSSPVIDLPTFTEEAIRPSDSMVTHVVRYNAPSLRLAQEQTGAPARNDWLAQHCDFSMNGTPAALISTQHGSVECDAPL